MAICTRLAGSSENVNCFMEGEKQDVVHFTFQGIVSGTRTRVQWGTAADSRQDSRTGSLLFEVNMSMWQYGRPFSCTKSVEEAVAIKKTWVQESRARGAATRQRRRGAAARNPPGGASPCTCVARAPLSPPCVRPASSLGRGARRERRCPRERSARARRKPAPPPPRPSSESHCDGAGSEFRLRSFEPAPT